MEAKPLQIYLKNDVYFFDIQYLRSIRAFFYAKRPENFWDFLLEGNFHEIFYSSPPGKTLGRGQKREEKIMQFIKLKGVQAQRFRKNGSREITPLFVTKAHKFGQPQTEITVSKKKNILITGDHDSGKTKSLLKLYDHALDVWGGQAKAKATLYFDAIQPLGEWYDSEPVSDWYTKKFGGNWKKLQNYEKAKILPKFCKEKKVILFIDNADNLSKSKVALAKQCILSSKIVVATVQAENRLSPSIRRVLLSSDPQFLRLSSEVAYDATNVLLWSFIAVCVAAGMWEVAFILGGMKVLGTGRRASKQV